MGQWVKKQNKCMLSFIKSCFLNSYSQKDQCLSQVPQWTTDSLVLRTLTALLGRFCHDTLRQTSRHKTVYAKGGAEARNKWYNAFLHHEATPLDVIWANSSCQEKIQQFEEACWLADCKEKKKCHSRCHLRDMNNCNARGFQKGPVTRPEWPWGATDILGT